MNKRLGYIILRVGIVWWACVGGLLKRIGGASWSSDVSGLESEKRSY